MHPEYKPRYIADMYRFLFDEICQHFQGCLKRIKSVKVSIIMISIIIYLDNRKTVQRKTILQCKIIKELS